MLLVFSKHIINPEIKRKVNFNEEFWKLENTWPILFLHSQSNFILLYNLSRLIYFVSFENYSAYFLICKPTFLFRHQLFANCPRYSLFSTIKFHENWQESISISSNVERACIFNKLLHPSPSIPKQIGVDRDPLLRIPFQANVSFHVSH